MDTPRRAITQALEDMLKRALDELYHAETELRANKVIDVHERVCRLIDSLREIRRINAG